MTLILITKPSTGPITVAEAKAHLRVSHSDEDELIASLIDAATGWLDGRVGVLGMALIAQTWEWTLGAFPRGCIKLPLGPVASITSIKYTNRVGTEQTVPPADYGILGDVLTGTWPQGSAVQIRYIAGEGCPDPIKMVVKLLVGHWYENREAVGDKLTAVPMAVDMLIAPYRRVGV
jgi:uncharacterized phiE125 gp8 family phage protein